MNVIEVQESNKPPVAAVLCGSFQEDPDEHNSHSIFRRINTPNVADNSITQTTNNFLQICRMVSHAEEAPALEAPVPGTCSPLPPPLKKDAPQSLPAWHPQRLFKAITFDNSDDNDGDSLSSAGSVAEDSILSALTEAESFLPAQVAQHKNNNYAFSPLAKADAFHFGANITSVEKSVGRNVMQSMLSDLLEKNQELTRTVRRLSEAHSMGIEVVPKPDTNKVLPITCGELSDIATTSSRDSHSTGILIQKDATLLALRAHNESLLRDLAKAEKKRMKQVMKAQYWKDLARQAGVDICDSRSDMSSIGTIISYGLMETSRVVPSIDAESVASKNFVLAESNTNQESLNSNFVISGLAAYQFQQLVSDLQANVNATNSWSRRDALQRNSIPAASDSDKSNDLENIYAAGAVKYATHVQEQGWAGSPMALRWEPVPAI